jgi:hypothetical protein
VASAIKTSLVHVPSSSKKKTISSQWVGAGVTGLGVGLHTLITAQFLTRPNSALQHSVRKERTGFS